MTADLLRDLEQYDDNIDPPMSEPERLAWVAALKLAEASPGKTFNVWRTGGKYVVIRQGDPEPTRGKNWGGVRFPLHIAPTVKIYHVYDERKPTGCNWINEVRR